jgi:hypothetical protein
MTEVITQPRRDGTRWLVFTAVLMAVGSVWLWTTVAHDLTTWRQHQQLDRRGVPVRATVLDSHYDEAGGDPGGWTTDRVTFVTASGTRVTTTLGHHYPGNEKQQGWLVVTYDPEHPQVARATGVEDSRDTPDEAITGAILAVLTTLGAAGIALVAVRQRRVSRGR